MLQHALLADGGGPEPPLDAAGRCAPPEHLPPEGPHAVHARAVARRCMSLRVGRRERLALVRRLVRVRGPARPVSAPLDPLLLCGFTGATGGRGHGCGFGCGGRVRLGPAAAGARAAPAALLRPARAREEQEHLPVRVPPEAQLAQGGPRLHQHAHRTRPHQRHAGVLSDALTS